MAFSERLHYRGARQQSHRGSNALLTQQSSSYKRLETNPIETLSTFEIFMKTKINESNTSHLPPLREPPDHSRRMSIGQTLPSLVNHDGISTDISQRKIEVAFAEEKKIQRKKSKLSGLRKFMLMQPVDAASKSNPYRAPSVEKFGNTLQKIGAQPAHLRNFHNNTPPNFHPQQQQPVVKSSSDSLRTSKYERFENKIRNRETSTNKVDSLFASTKENAGDSTARNEKADTQLIAYDSMKSFYANISNGNLTTNREQNNEKLKKAEEEFVELLDRQFDLQEEDPIKAVNAKVFPALPKLPTESIPEIQNLERFQLLDSFRAKKAPNSHRTRSTLHSKRASILPSDINTSQASLNLGINNSASVNHLKKPVVKQSRPSITGDYLPDWLGQRKDFQEACQNISGQTKQNIPIACSKPSYSRTIEEIEAITIWLLKIKVFRSLPRKIVETISEKVKLKEYQNNEILCNQGDQGDCLYIVFSGKVRCLVDGVQVAIYKSGDAMGQTALDGATPRTATLIAATSAQILRLESDDYKFTMEYYALKQRDDFLSTLKKVKIFEDMDFNKQTIIVAALQSKYYTKGEVIYNEGGSAEALYILRKGKVRLESSLMIEKENLWPVGSQVWEKLTVMRESKFSFLVQENQFFGEIEIIKNCKRLHRSICVEDCQVLIFSKKDFFGLLDPDDLAKAKYLIKDSLLQDAEKMKKKVIETENHQKKMKEVMIRALSDQLTFLNDETLKRRHKNFVEPGIQRVNKNLKEFIQQNTRNSVSKYEKILSNLE